MKAVFLPSSLLFKIVSLTEGNMPAGALGWRRAAAQPSSPGVDWGFPDHAEQPWEATALQAGLEAALCFAGTSALVSGWEVCCSIGKDSSEVAGWPQACSCPDLMLLGQLRSFPSVNIAPARRRQ